MKRNFKTISNDSPKSDELKILIDNLEDYAVFKIDEKGKILSWNEGVKRILGYEEKEFIGKNFSIIFSKEDRRNKMDKLELTNVKKFGKAADERWHVKKNGYLFRASGIVTDLRDSKGELQGFIKIMRDITDEIEAERKIKESEERYKSLVNNTSEAIWRFELEKPISIKASVEKQINHFYKYAYLGECNQAMAKLYGFDSIDQVMNLRLSEFLIKDDPKNIQYLKQFIKSGYKLVNAESKEMDSEGDERYFSNNLIGVIEDDLLLRAWGSQRDITILYETLRQKDEFVGIVSHELKTPLTTIKAYIQLLASKFKDSENNAALYLSKVNAQVNKLTTLINELLDMTRMESGKFQVANKKFNLGELVEEIVEDMQNSTDKHHITIEKIPKLTIKNDRERVGQILINLISNAIKYSPDSEKVIIKVLSNKKTLKIQVQDFGIGISKKYQKKIFERFFRADGDKKNTFPGLGLGLYISAEIAKKLGGSLSVQSEKGKGSTFSFNLPI